MLLQNNEYRSESGHRIIVVRENELQVLLNQITPRTEAAEQITKMKTEVLALIEKGKWQFVRNGYFTCDTSPMPLTIRKEKPKDSGKPIHKIKQMTII